MAYEKVIYLSGPYRNPNPWQIVQNIRLAEAAHIALLRKGWSVVDPHKNTSHLEGAVHVDPEHDHAMFIAADCAIIRRLDRRRDAMYMLPGWESSKGSRIEKGVAETIGLPIYCRMEDVPDLTK